MIMRTISLVFIFLLISCTQLVSDNDITKLKEELNINQPQSIKKQLCLFADMDGKLAEFVKNVNKDKKMIKLSDEKFYQSVRCEENLHLLTKAIQLKATKNIDFLVFEERIPLNLSRKMLPVADWIKKYARICQDDDVCWEHLLVTFKKVRNPILYMQNYLDNGENEHLKRYYQKLLQKAKEQNLTQSSWGARFSKERKKIINSTSPLESVDCIESGVDCLFL